jgi:hypothetical protein
VGWGVGADPPADTPSEGGGVMGGADLIAAERQRQVEAEGWTTHHDDWEHRDGELVLAAFCYLTKYGALINGERCGDPDPPDGWPWDASWWKPSSPIRNLVKAGALIAAEIDRLQRAHSDGPEMP